MREPGRSPTVGLLAGLAVTLLAVGLYSGYTIQQLRSLRRLQAETIDRNRADSLLLLRIQNNLNSIALGLRDMLESSEPYPLTAWRSQFQRIRTDMTDAIGREEKVSGATAEQQKYLRSSLTQFWDALDRLFSMAENGQDQEARTQIRLSMHARQEALSTSIARLLVQNIEREQHGAEQAQEIYGRAERNVYLFLAAMLALIAAIGLSMVQRNRRMFAQEQEVSQQRRELVQQLLSTQENTFRHISRELHDEFGQILTAIGVMLQRASRMNEALRDDLLEVRSIVQATLEKVRSLSRALHPVVLDDMGFEGALALFLPSYEKQTGVAIRYVKEGESRPIDRDIGVHLYRILQEALNNVARHAKASEATVRLQFAPERLFLEIADDGVGHSGGKGMGWTSMRERAELLHGQIELVSRDGGGSVVRLSVPLVPLEVAAGAA